RSASWPWRRPSSAPSDTSWPTAPRSRRTPRVRARVRYERAPHPRRDARFRAVGDGGRTGPGRRGGGRRDRPPPPLLPRGPLDGGGLLLRRAPHRHAHLVARVRMDGIPLRRPLGVPLVARLAGSRVRGRVAADVRALV